MHKLKQFYFQVNLLWWCSNLQAIVTHLIQLTSSTNSYLIVQLHTTIFCLSKSEEKKELTSLLFLDTVIGKLILVTVPIFKHIQELLFRWLFSLTLENTFHLSLASTFHKQYFYLYTNTNATQC